MDVWYHSIRHGRTPVEVCQLSLQGIEKLKTWIDSLVFSKSIFSYLEAPCNLKPQYYLFFIIISHSLRYFLHEFSFANGSDCLWILKNHRHGSASRILVGHVSYDTTLSEHLLNKHTCLTFYYIILFTLSDTLGKLFGQVKETLWVKM